MKKASFALAVLSWAALSAPVMKAQDKPAETKVPVSTLKVQVTISEYEGEKKVANLPYSFFVQAADVGPSSPWTKVRMGSRVPILTGKEGAFQYLDVGTNIDARGLSEGGGRFTVMLNLERSWVEGDAVLTATKTTGPRPNPGEFKEPIIRQFKSEVAFSMRDGQTIQTTQAADPLSARVLTITVTMNVVR